MLPLTPPHLFDVLRGRQAGKVEGKRQSRGFSQVLQRFGLVCHWRRRWFLPIPSLPRNIIPNEKFSALLPSFSLKNLTLPILILLLPCRRTNDVVEPSRWKPRRTVDPFFAPGTQLKGEFSPLALRPVASIAKSTLLALHYSPPSAKRPPSGQP